MKKIKFNFFFIIIFKLYYLSCQAEEISLIHQWKQLEYNFPSLAARNAAIYNGFYVNGSGFPIDVDVDFRSRLFVTIPRFNLGVPITLGVVNNMHSANGPTITAYPHYSWQSSHGRNCNGITSVFRIAIDACNRLWVLDSGRIGTQQYCPPQLIVFNLHNDQIVHRYRFPPHQYQPGVSLFVTPIVDVLNPPPLGNCMKTKVYIADTLGFGLLVYDLERKISWRVEHNSMKPNRPFVNHTIAGESFELPDGIIGMSLTPPKYSKRNLYFHALASSKENQIPLDSLENPNTDVSARTIGNRNGQAVAQAMDSNGYLYFGSYDPIAIMKWHISKPYNPNSFEVVAENPETLQFVSGIKVIQNAFGNEELWVVSNRFQKVMAQSLDPNEINFRIQRITLNDGQFVQAVKRYRVKTKKPNKKKKFNRF